MKYFVSILSILFLYINLCGQSIDVDANLQLQKVVDSLFTKNGDNYYSIVEKGVEGDRSWSKNLRELNSVSFILEKEELTQADSLNFFQWKGKIKITCAAYRTIQWSNSTDWGEHYPLESALWKEWEKGVIVEVMLFKKHRTWKFIIPENPIVGNWKPSIQQINSALLRPMENKK